ncbi:MAG: hypothetical protein R2715_06760 [Ilumatobacteraceae bacterium]
MPFVAAASAGLLLVVGAGVTWALSSAQPYAARPMPFLVLFLLFVVLETARGDVLLGPLSHAVTMSELVFVIGVLTARPWQIGVAHALAVKVVFGLFLRQTTVKWLVNSAAVLAGTSIGVLIARVIAGSGDSSPRVALGCIVGCLGSTAVTWLLFVISASAVGRKASSEITLRDLGLSVASALSAGAIGVELVFLGRIDIRLAGLSLVPIFLALWALRSYAAQRVLARRSGLLHKVTAVLHESDPFEMGLLESLELTRASLWADSVELVLLTGYGDDAVLAHRELARTRPVHPAAPDVLAASGMLAATLTAARAVDGNDPAAVMLGAFGVEAGVAAPVYVEHHVAGLLVVGDRDSSVAPYASDDVTTVGVVAQQLGRRWRSTG